MATSIAGKHVPKIQSLNNQSLQVSHGPPEKRLLNTMKENLDESGNIRKWIFGTKNPGKMCRTVMMMGETGTGKSTLINVMTNYILGVEWDDQVRYELVHEEKKCQTESQTTAITVYEIFGQEDGRVPFSLRIIDTPGYGDTKGVENDKLIAKNLCEIFSSEKGVHQIDAVCLVVKASQNRLTPIQRYIFDEILSLFGKDLKNNIIAVITFSEGGKPPALAAIDKAGVPCARDEKNCLIHFRFNNVSEEEKDEEDEEFILRNWNKGGKNMKAFFEHLNTLEMRSLEMTKEVLLERSQLECAVESLQDQIKNIEHLQTELKQTKEALGRHKGEIEANKDFEFQVEKVFKEKIESDENATSCNKCEFTCHYPCTTVPKNWLNWCAVMKGSNCTSCPGKCSYDDHVKEKKRYQTRTRMVTKTFHKLKEEFERASGQKATAEVLERSLQEDIKNTECEKRALIEKSYRHVVRLNEIALRPESMSTLQHLDFLIERLRELGEHDKEQHLEDMKKKACKTQNVSK